MKDHSMIDQITSDACVSMCIYVYLCVSCYWIYIDETSAQRVDLGLATGELHYVIWRQTVTWLEWICRSPPTGRMSSSRSSWRALRSWSTPTPPPPHLPSDDDDDDALLLLLIYPLTIYYSLSTLWRYTTPHPLNNTQRHDVCAGCYLADEHGATVAGFIKTSWSGHHETVQHSNVGSLIYTNFVVSYTHILSLLSNLWSFIILAKREGCTMTTNRPLS